MTQGRIVSESGEVEFTVTDTQRDAELIIHSGVLTKGRITEGLEVQATVDPSRRDGIMRAHSATHMLHHALQSILGKHAQQQGSKVDEDWLRFDFINQQALSEGEIEQVESIVHEKVKLSAPISWNTVPLAEAKQAGAMMLFGEKYPDPVRMVSMGEFSKELCGGTHLNNTSQVEHFEVVVEEGVSAGTRRVVALTGPKAEEHRQKLTELLTQAANSLGCSPSQLLSADPASYSGSSNVEETAFGYREGNYCRRCTKLPEVRVLPRTAGDRKGSRESTQCWRNGHCHANYSARGRKIKARVAGFTNRCFRGSLGGFTARVCAIIGDVAVIVSETPGANPNMMRQWIDQARQKADKPTAVLFASKMGENKVLLVAG